MLVTRAEIIAQMQNEDTKHKLTAVIMTFNLNAYTHESRFEFLFRVTRMMMYIGADEDLPEPKPYSLSEAVRGFVSVQ
jgi:hypothetical protein